MKLLSFNCMGLANNPKQLVLARLVELYCLNVFVLQETMCGGSGLVIHLKILMKEWDFVWADGKGLSGGLLTGWKDNMSMLNCFSFTSSLGTTFNCKDLDLAFTIFNVYGPIIENSLSGTTSLGNCFLRICHLLS